VPLQGLRIAADAESAPRPCDNDRAHIVVPLGEIEAVPVLGMHPTRPGVHALRTVQRDRRNLIRDGITRGFVIHQCALVKTLASIQRLQLRESEHQPLRSIACKVHLHPSALAVAFGLQHHTLAELSVRHTLADA